MKIKANKISYLAIENSSAFLMEWVKWRFPLAGNSFTATCHFGNRKHCEYSSFVYIIFLILDFTNSLIIFLTIFNCPYSSIIPTACIFKFSYRLLLINADLCHLMQNWLVCLSYIPYHTFCISRTWLANVVCF
jgi:hypothetical protein